MPVDCHWTVPWRPAERGMPPLFLGLLQTAGLRTAEASSLSGGRLDVLSAGGRAVLARGASGRPFLPLPASGGPRRPSAWGCITPVSAPVLMWPLLRICVFTFSVSLKTLVTGFRVCLEHPDDLISRSLSISLETLISNKAARTGLGAQDRMCVFRGYGSPHYRHRRRLQKTHR